MHAPTNSPSAEASGLTAFVIFARLYGIDLDDDELAARLGTRCFGLPEMYRAAKLFGFDAKVRPATWSQLTAVTLPAIAALRSGDYLIVAQVADEMVLVLHPLADKPQVLARAEFEVR